MDDREGHDFQSCRKSESVEPALAAEGSASVNHEQELIKAFVLPTKRQRYLDFIAKATTRRKFLRELGHFKHLDPRYAREIHLSPAGLDSLLKGLGVPDSCWIISEISEIDGKLVLVSDVLRELGRDLGTFLSFVPGKLAYFEDEDGAWILQRLELLMHGPLEN